MSNSSSFFIEQNDDNSDDSGFQIVDDANSNFDSIQNAPLD